MTIAQAILTMVGGFLFPFMIKLMWDRMVDNWGAAGGWMAGAFIVGVAWLINHGLVAPLIFQTGAWVDQALAAGVGLWVASKVDGDSIKKSLPNVIQGFIGAVIGGYLLSLFL